MRRQCETQCENLIEAGGVLRRDRLEYPRRVPPNSAILNYANACNQRLSNNSNNNGKWRREMRTKQKARTENDCDMKNMPATLAYKSFASADCTPNLPPWRPLLSS